MLRGSLLLVSTVSLLAAQTFDPANYAGLRWRDIGPYRGGRTVGAAGIPAQPNVFYIGVNNGGVWKTDDYGRTWKPIFDEQPTGSIGALAIAPSDPNTIYVGSGEGLQRPDLSVGDGMYKSTDGGKTWRHLGLRDAQQIPAILVDPRNPNRLFVAVLGHPYGPNPERGVFRSVDGGQTWQKVLYKDERTGAIDLAFDPRNPADRLRRPLAGATGSVGKRRLLRSQQRPVQIHRWRHHVESADRRAPHVRARRARTHRHRHRANRPQSHVRPGRSARSGGRRLPLRRCGRQLDPRQHRAADLRPRQRFRLRPRRPEEQGRHLRRQHLHLPLRRRRKEFHLHQGRAGRRRLSHHLDQSAEPRYHPAGRGPGRHHQRQPRPDLEQLVQPADRPVLSRHHRQPDAVLGLRRTAGERLRRCRQPRQRRPDHLSRLAPRRRRRVRLRRARPAQSQHHLRQQGNQVQPHHRGSRARRTRAATIATCAPPRCFSAMSIRTCSTWVRRWSSRPPTAAGTGKPSVPI